LFGYYLFDAHASSPLTLTRLGMSDMVGWMYCEAVAVTILTLGVKKYYWG